MNVLLQLINRRAWSLGVACVALVGFTPNVRAAFIHPGGLHTQADLDRMKTQVAAGAHPWIDGWNRLLSDTSTLLSYSPSPSANMGTSRQNASRDAHAAYNAVIRWAVTGDTAYADKAVQICNAWSAVVNQVPTGTDIPGLSGIPVAEFAYVGEILRTYSGWAPADFNRFKTMMLTWWYPVCHNFLLNHNNTNIDHWWSNWDISNVGAIMAIGVLCDDQAKFDEAVDYFKNGGGTGSIMNAVYVVHPDGLGQWQESGRDQEHAQLAVGMMAAFCELAWKQGVDLYSYAGNRLLAGAEYVARTNLSRPVPYAFYTNSDDANHYYISVNGLGRLDDRPVWELIYNHYVVRMGQSAPNVQAMAQVTRPEHGSTDHFGYGTLTFTLDASASPYPASPVPPVVTGPVATAGVARVMLQWDPSSGDTAHGFKVQRATTSGGPYTTIASWTENTYPQYTDTSVTNGTTYYYVVAANNQSGTGGNSAEVSATPMAAGALPDGWARQDIGSVSSAGSASYASVGNNTFVVTGNGTGIGGSADSLSFACGTIAGDCTITGRLLVNGNIKAGFLMRESLAANARAVSLTLGDVGGRETFFGTRSTTGGTMGSVLGNDYTWTPVWYRLQRSGNTFTGSQSLDGVTWFVVGTGTVPMSGTYYAGLAVCGATATFDNINVVGTFVAGPPGSLAALNGPGQVSLSWNASSGATSYNLKRAPTAGGPYTVIAPGLTTTSYVDPGLTNGTEYYYVVSAVQGSFESANSNEVQGLPGDVAVTWGATPASANWNLGANWVGGVVPGNDDSLSFGASSATSLNNNIPGLSLNRITFKSGAGAFTLAGNAVALNGDILNNAGTTQTISLGLTLNGTRTISPNTGPITISGVIGGAGAGIVKAGSQPLSLTAPNTFTGDVTLATGTLSIAGIGTGTAGSPTTGALGRGLVQLGGGLLTSSAAATVFNNVVLQPGTTTGIASNTANITFAGNISGSGNITESGANVGGTHFNGDNSGFTGTFTSSNATNHRVRFNRTTSGSASATWVLNNSQTDGYGLAIAGGGTISFGALSGGGQFRSDAGNNTTVTLSVGALNTNTTFGGLLVVNGTQAIALTKVGTGALALTGANTYIGATTVTAGTLLVNNSLRSAVTVTGGIFGGTGGSNSPIAVNAGGTFAPGNLAVGTFTTTADLLLGSGANYALQLNSGNSTADRIVANGVGLAGASLNAIDLGSTSLPGGRSFTIIDNTAATPVGGTFAGAPEGAILTVGANLYRITYAGGTGNDVMLTVVLPATVSLGNLTQTYDSTPKPVTVSTSAAGATVNVTYNGSATVPTHAGVYTVVATIADAVYVGTATGTLTIDRMPVGITLADSVQAYNGTPRTVPVATSPAGLAVTMTYNGLPTPPIYPATHAVVATVDDPDHQGTASASLKIRTTALVRHAPTVNGTVDGSVQLLSAENVALGGTSTVTTDLLVPGMPGVTVGGSALLAGTLDGPGDPTPATHGVSLSGSAVVRYLVRRIDPVALPVVAAPPAPAGTRTVSLTAAGQSAGDFSTLRNLSVSGTAGLVAVPPGTYGAFTASANNGFILGVAGATEPAIYNLQNLTINLLPGNGGKLQVIGPVVITLANGTILNGLAGTAAHPEWLVLRIASGGLSVSGNNVFHGSVIAPNGTVTLGNTATLNGTVVSDKLTVNATGVLNDPDL